MAHHHHQHSQQQQQKQLFQLLQDDQEPFVLNNYIADHCQLTRTKPKRTKPACFFPITNSPASAVADPRKSPLYFPKSPVAAKTRPTKSRVHSKTASLLLEAAIRVTHKTQSSSSRGGKIGAGIFGSLLKRLGTNNKKSKKDRFDDVKVSVKDILRQEDVRKKSKSNSVSPTRNAVRCGGCESGPSSAVWSSESNESIDLDLGCHSSSSGGGGFLSEEEEIEFVDQVVDFASYDDDKQYCESPFRFTLERSLSSSTAGRRTPEFSSPVASPPVCFKTEGNEKTRDVEIEEEEEEKEQCSPVSVLDPPFEDDDDVEREEDDDGGFDMECSFAFVQKAKLQLLQKLRRFERLAELDPVELEKTMLEYDDEKYDERESGCESTILDDNYIDEFILDELSKSSMQCPRSVPQDMKRLVSDMMDEEEREGYNGSSTGGECATKRVCKRFELWNEVESNSIELMVEHDCNGSQNEWRRNGDQVKDIALEIELAIFGLLVEELIL